MKDLINKIVNSSNLPGLMVVMSAIRVLALTSPLFHICQGVMAGSEPSYAENEWCEKP